MCSDASPDHHWKREGSRERSALPASYASPDRGPLGNFYKQPKSCFQELLEHLRLQILLEADGC